MTQRVDLATVMDLLAIDSVITDYAVAVDDGDWGAYLALFAPSGRADYRTAGGIEGTARDVTVWLAESTRPFPMRQHLIVNRRARVDVVDGDAGDTAQVLADFVNPMCASERTDEGGATAPDFVAGGRCTFALVRTAGGWRIGRVTVQEKWRQTRYVPAMERPGH